MKTIKDELLNRASALDDSATRSRAMAASLRTDADTAESDAAYLEQRAREYRALADTIQTAA